MMEEAPFEGTRVLVTGATGFIGRHLVRTFAEAGSNVIALDLGAISPFEGESRVDYRQVDICDEQKMRAVLSGVDTVFHLASMHLQVHAREDAFLRVNVEAAGALVDLSAAAGVRRLVHTSSVGVYGHVRSPPAGENDPKNPETPYERSKLAGEIRVTQRAEQTGLDVVVLRPAWVYGPGCPRTEKLLRAISRKRFFYIGDGSNLRHPVHIADTVTAFKLAAMSPPAVGSRVYNIAGPQPLPLRQMIEEFARIIGVSAPRLAIPRSIGWLAGLATEKAFGVLRREPPFSRRSLAFFMNDNAFSTAAAERELGFRPEVGFEEGLRRTIAEVHQP